MNTGHITHHLLFYGHGTFFVKQCYIGVKYFRLLKVANNRSHLVTEQIELDTKRCKSRPPDGAC
uniref:Uncharacterized protein n=1 Tax=Triticum urartu TaxID=4572 RepID=A0A8R7P923_TRIUA